MVCYLETRQKWFEQKPQHDNVPHAELGQLCFGKQKCPFSCLLLPPVCHSCCCLWKGILLATSMFCVLFLSPCLTEQLKCNMHKLLHLRHPVKKMIWEACQKKNCVEPDVSVPGMIWDTMPLDVLLEELETIVSAHCWQHSQWSNRSCLAPSHVLWTGWILGGAFVASFFKRRHAAGGHLG